MRTTYNLLKYILLFGFIVIISAGDGFPQNAAKKTTRMQVEYIKDADQTEFLIATLIVREERYVPLQRVEIHFFNIGDTTTLIGKVVTDELGQATLVLKENQNIDRDSLGVMTFEVEYRGSSTRKAVSRKISVKQAELEISFFQKDSVKSIDVDLHELGLEDQINPVSGQDISFFIKGTFSLLNFDKGKTDKNGHLRVNFPIDMPGDTAGVLTILAKVIEDDTYGTIESKGAINWGIPVPLAVEKRRGLGDTDAPLWMVYTLIILLSAVWFHYLYVIILIIKIKLKGMSPKRKLSKKQELSIAE